MKNVILTHKELQMNMVAAFADGFCQTFKMPQGYFLSWSSNAQDFSFELWQSATKPENGDAKNILTYNHINKGAYEMNDVRLGVCIVYLRGHAQKFIEQVEEWFKEKHRKEFNSEVGEKNSPIV